MLLDVAKAAAHRRLGRQKAGPARLQDREHRLLRGDRIFQRVVVVAPDFRSRRSLLVYSRVFGPAGISTGCFPVFGRRTTSNWADSWHGLQEVGLQFLKLQFYRFYVFR